MSDLISRQDAVDAMHRLEAEDIERYGCSIPEGFHSAEAIEALQALPSAEPERKKGEWLEKDVFTSTKGKIKEWQSTKCSVCGKYHTTPYLYYFDKFPYCPHCGADMRGECESDL